MDLVVATRLYIIIFSAWNSLDSLIIIEDLNKHLIIIMKLHTYVATLVKLHITEPN